MYEDSTIQLPAYQDILPQRELAVRLAKSIGHLQLIPRIRLVRDLAYPDRRWSYGADFVGRWLDVMSTASRLPPYQGCEFGVDPVVDDLCKFQRPDGMLGKRDDNTGLGATGGGLLGLVEAYVTFGNQQAIPAASRLVDYLDEHFPSQPTQRACFALRALVRYGEVSGDDRGFRVARRWYDTCFELGPDCPFDRVFGNAHIYK